MIADGVEGEVSLGLLNESGSSLVRSMSVSSLCRLLDSGAGG